MTEYLTEHRKKVADLSLELRGIQTGNFFVLNKKTSNLFRNRKPIKNKIDVKHLNQVLLIDCDNLTAEVEGMTTYEELVTATLKYNLMPCVVPQLKTITVGGALSGVAIEASSFRYGLVHETFIEFDVCLASGEVVTCTATNEHQDLFFGFPNSYGTLGYATRIKLKLVPTKKFVKLTHIHFQDPASFYEKLNQSCRSNQDIDFIDGVLFGSNNCYLTTASMVDEAPFLSDYKYLNIYYRSLTKKTEDYLTIKDYIWRWDSDWFWCSKNFGMQNFWMRLIFGKFVLRSDRYWKIMNFTRNNFLAKKICDLWYGKTESIIQDVEIPLDNCINFHNFFYKHINITPVWVCPAINYQADKKFPFYALEPHTLFVNFGFWEAIPSTHEAGYFNRLIEQKVEELKGHKSLYSAVYYSEQQFWDIFDKSLYQKLKQRYDPNLKLKNLYCKVTEK